MAFKEIADKIEYARGLSQRYRTLDQYERVLNGTFYDHLPYAFNQEDNYGEYVSLDERRPSVQFNIPHIVCSQIASLMWANEQTPKVQAPGLDEKSSAEIEKNVEALINTLGLDFIMLSATLLGQPGSVAIIVRSKKNGLPMFETVAGKNCMPIFDAYDPDELKSFIQMWDVDGSELLSQGYQKEASGKDIKSDSLYWMRIVFNDISETRYLPLLDSDFQRIDDADPRRSDGSKIEWIPDEDNFYMHDFKCVPVAWIKNLVPPNSKAIDGPCTYEKILDIQVKIDRDTSQIARGLEYMADPVLAIVQNGLGPSMGLKSAGGVLGSNIEADTDSDGAIVKSVDRVIKITDGDAKLLEISGQGLKTALEYVLTLREWALEVLGGMKSSAQNQASVQSGRALEILYQTLVILVKQQRIAYGDRGLIPLIKIILTGMKNGELTIPNVEPFDINTALRLKWPNWLTPTSSDLLANTQAWQIMAGGSNADPVALLPIEEVTMLIANELGLSDTNALQMAVMKMKAEREAQKQAELDSKIKLTPNTGSDSTDNEKEQSNSEPPGPSTYKDIL